MKHVYMNIGAYGKYENHLRCNVSTKSCQSKREWYE